MMSVLFALIGLLPSFLQRPIRNLLGARIAAGARIAPFTLITVRDLKMERGARIGPFVVMRTGVAALGRNARIRPLTLIKVRRFEMGRDALIDPLVLVNCDMGPRSSLILGRHVRVFSFSVLEPSEGIEVGDHSGLGGHTLIFCHGSWPNYLEGAPYARGPVRIGEEVWIPWRVMILPNVEIGSGAVIGAHSLVRSSVPPRALFSGVPARQVVENVWTPVEDVAEKVRRLTEVVESFHDFHEGRYRGRVEVLPLSESPHVSCEEAVFWSFTEVTADDVMRARAGARVVSVLDLARLRAFVGGPGGREFVGHLATFGVRLSPTDPDEL